MINIDFCIHRGNSIDLYFCKNIDIDFNTHGGDEIYGPSVIDILRFGRMDTITFDKLDGIAFGEYLNLEELYEK